MLRGFKEAVTLIFALSSVKLDQGHFCYQLQFISTTETNQYLGSPNTGCSRAQPSHCYYPHECQSKPLALVNTQLPIVPLRSILIHNRMHVRSVNSPAIPSLRWHLFDFQCLTSHAATVTNQPDLWKYRTTLTIILINWRRHLSHGSCSHNISGSHGFSIPNEWSYKGGKFGTRRGQPLWASRAGDDWSSFRGFLRQVGASVMTLQFVSYPLRESIGRVT